MFNAMFTALFPVAFLILVGWSGGKQGLFQRSDATSFATLVIRYALPLSLFLAAFKFTPAEMKNIPFITTMFIGLMGTYLIALAMGRYVFRHDLKTSTMQALVCGFPDMAYFGAPVLMAVYGAAGLLPVLVGNLITSIFMLPLTIILTRFAESSPEEGKKVNVLAVMGPCMLKAVTNPMVWMPILGAILSLSGFKLPGLLHESIDMIAKCAGGVSLFALGLLFTGEKPKLDSNVLTNIGLKNFLMPALMLGGIVVFKVDHVLACQALIIGAVPTAVAASMFAIRAKTYEITSSASVLIGTVIGIGSVAAMVALVH